VYQYVQQLPLIMPNIAFRYVFACVHYHLAVSKARISRAVVSTVPQLGWPRLYLCALIGFLSCGYHACLKSRRRETHSSNIGFEDYVRDTEKPSRISLGLRCERHQKHLRRRVMILNAGLNFGLAHAPSNDARRRCFRSRASGSCPD